MKTKDWYNFMIQPIIYEQGSDVLIPCKSEIAIPLNDWPSSWRLSSESTTFLWKLLHNILPTRERLHKILPAVTNSICTACDSNQIGNIKHALAECSASSEVFNWMYSGLSKFGANLTVDKVLLLDIQQSEPLPFNELPLI